MSYRSYIALVALVIPGCGQDVETHTIQQAASQDGVWLARSLDERHFGPGTAGDVIRVTLSRRATDNSPQDILLLTPDSEPYPGKPASHIQLHWDAPNRLTLSYRDADADLIVSRSSGIEIRHTDLR